MKPFIQDTHRAQAGHQRDQGGGVKRFETHEEKLDFVLQFPQELLALFIAKYAFDRFLKWMLRENRKNA